MKEVCKLRHAQCTMSERQLGHIRLKTHYHNSPIISHFLPLTASLIATHTHSHNGAKNVLITSRGWEHILVCWLIQSKIKSSSWLSMSLLEDSNMLQCISATGTVLQGNIQCIHMHVSTGSSPLSGPFSPPPSLIIPFPCSFNCDLAVWLPQTWSLWS